MQIDFCEFPDDLLYDLEANVWIKVNQKGGVTLGITSVHAALAGRLNQVKLKAVGESVAKGKNVGTIESVKYFGAVRTPVSGRITETNLDLQKRAKLANDAPYTAGWFVTIEPTNLSEEITSLSKVQDVEERIRSMIREVRVRCFKAYPDYDMWEIGVECAAVLVRLNDLIERCAIGDVIHVVSDDPTADIEVERWAYDTGQLVLESRKDGKLMHFIVRRVK
ncbi:MAG: sulfurtransferase TusA family protein [Candidatus Bathyarchaeia archaeon]